MSRDWNPGDVAIIVGASRHAGQRAMFCDDGIDRRAWAVARTNGTSMAFGRGEVRPLVVIDPEDRDAVERLTRARWEAYREAASSKPCSFDGLAEGSRQERIDWMQAALREFAAPKPPRPEEPTGLGAVVEDEDGAPWLLVAPGMGKCRWARRGLVAGEWSPYADIAAVRILSPGVEVDQ